MSGNALTIFGAALVLVLAVSAAILLFSSSAIAADQFMLKYRIWESISVEELTTFAETGELSTSLRLNFALARQNPKVSRFI